MKAIVRFWDHLSGCLGLIHKAPGQTGMRSPNVEFYHSTFENLLEGCQVMDFNWRYIYLNRSAEIHSRKLKEDLIGKTFTETYPGVETTEVYAKIRQCLEERVSSRMVNRFVYPDEKAGWFLLSIHPVPEGAMIFSFDITVRIETERQLMQIKHLYSTLSQVNQIIVRVKEREELFRSICEVAVKFGQFSLAWVGLLDDQTGNVEPVAATGLDIRDWPFGKINIHAGNLQNTVTATAIRRSQVVSNEDIQGMGIDPVFDRQLKNYPFRSIAAVPFRLGGKVSGTLTLVSPERGFFRSQEEIELLNEMGMDISFALENIETNRIKQQWANAFEYCGHGIAIGISSQDSFQVCNPAFAKMHGGTIQEICSRPISSFYLTEDLDFMKGMIREADITGRVQFEVRKKKLDGSLFYAQVNLVNVYDKERKALYKVVTQQDISEKKRAEEMLRSSERNLKLFVQYAPAAIAMFNREMRYLAVSERFKSDYHLKEQDLVGRSHYELFPEIPSDIKNIHERCLAGAVEKREEDAFPRKDGTVDWVRWEMHPWFESGDAIGGVILFSEVITGRKLAEQEVRRISQYFQSLILKAPDGFVLITGEGKFSFISPAARKMLGYTPEDFVADDPASLTHPDDLQEVISQLQQIFGNPAYSPTLQYRFRHRNGTWRWIESTFSNRLSDPDIHAVVINFRDVTERKKTEEALQISEAEVRKLNLELEERVTKRTAELQAANRELEAFSYSVSHDLRAPLRGINGFIQILLEDYAGTLDKEGERLCSVIRDNAINMATLIDDLLAFSRLNRAGMSLATVDMLDLAGEAFREAREAGLGKKVEFRLEKISGALGDRTMLRQVWANLISNAIKYSSTREKPVISITCKAEKDHVIYCVSDNGVGFDMKYHDKLFAVFQRLHSPKEFEGTGVGLAIVQRIVQRHGGRVWAEGEINRGASFYFSLPLPQGEK